MQFTIKRGDCLAAMREMPDNSVDSIVTDPPYELGFMGKDWDASGIANSVEMWTEALRVLKPGGHLLAFSGSRTYHRMTCAIEDAGFEVRDQMQWIYGSGFPKSLDVSKAIDKANSKYLPGTDAARQWEGWGTALKPAHEPICVARKPLTGTVAANVLAFGTGALNIDGCRVGSSGGCKTEGGGERKESQPGAIGAYESSPSVDGLGRWPANIIHDGSAEVAALFPESKGQQGRAKDDGETSGNAVYGALRNVTTNPEPRGDTGSAARFFYCAKASKADRNAGCGHMPLKVAGGMAGRADGSMGSVAYNNNIHPTVKPTDLMVYLVRLVTPPGGLVLDPFMGSGSTGKAAMREGFRFIGCELSDEYADIAEARITHELVGDLL